MDVWTVNLRRMHPWQDNDRYLQDRIVESLGIGYQDHWPFRQCDHRARREKEHAFTIGSRPRAPASANRRDGSVRIGTRGPDKRRSYAYGWGRQNWFSNNAEEHAAVRERVGVFEQSSFAKLMVQGRDAVGALNGIATANVDVAIGRCVYTQFLNARRRYRSGSDRHPARRRAVPRGHGCVYANACRSLDSQSHSRWRALHRDRFVGRLRDAQCAGARRSCAAQCGFRR